MLKQLFFATVMLLGISMNLLAEKRSSGGSPDKVRSIVIAVSDPLALELACACVNGHAQRNYHMLAKFLEKELSSRYKVKVIFVESIEEAMRESNGGANLFIGKKSVLLYDAKKLGMLLRPVSALTGKDGTTRFSGLFVVRKESPAKSVEDLTGYKLHCGMPYMQEKYAAAFDALHSSGIKVGPVVTHSQCSAAALALFDDKMSSVAVISDYALPLLEGCGAIEPDSLKVIGKTQPVPFVYLFASEQLSRTDESLIIAALKKVKNNSLLCEKMETQKGFVDVPVGASQWTGWRGTKRDGLVDKLPEKLPRKPNIIWTAKLTHPSGSLAGVALFDNRVVAADRDDLTSRDIFICFDAASGEVLWCYSYKAIGDLDYGNSPRATPLIDGGAVYTLGAMGDLSKIDLQSGRLHWRINFKTKFGAELTEWGHCASPLLVNDKLIVMPGAEQASVVALNPQDGSVLWQSPGQRAAYSSPVAGELGGREQIVGYDSESLGGWDVESGRRLWSLKPPIEGDFNVPTPVLLSDGRLLVMSENNGTRIYSFIANGLIRSKPDAVNLDLSADSMTPVVACGRVCGVHEGLRILSAKDLKEIALVKDKESETFYQYASVIADRRGCILVTSVAGELLLYDFSTESPHCVSRMQILSPDEETLSHPAIAGNRLYLCGPQKLYCIGL